jgi:hypothetical protein
VLTGADARPGNTYKQPNNIRSYPFQGVHMQKGKASILLPPLMITALTFAVTIPGE